MPELPEVEVTRLSIAKGISGAVIESVVMGKPLRWPLGCPPELLTGRTVVGVRRRGKYLLLDLDVGLLLVHLGMSGSLRLGHDLGAAGPHDHFEMATTSGTLRLRDPRRFGAVVWAESEDDPVARKLLINLGVEPLSDLFTVDGLFSGLRASRSTVKQVLLGGKVVVGVGNIYASEVLFLAGIRPTAKSSTISLERARRLHAAIRQVLARAVERGGSTLRDFASADGSEGHFQLEAHVYGRHNEACRACGSPVRMIRQGQRSTYYCMRCQKA
ncbi:bifunctional DNA-formamidopyrimidine glycosylase/DNA-(apurinic or apyrimidinic site) lyase [Paracidovorax valerianellae]|uniref:Formamidopyrimidine-DNA glycosylase n=1 Tax=Paracidovorax valerianellae TaxID=187868 RepID=A0A1G6NSS9_9BURK|nr:bifunctional DNA-formamidopyrimidine glycosylase/DNA-(apurinic or apyrimidinic site) lyase [Paracidovorax valerianellae]MDA8444635.1 bifunctional DNA-formamidopyrimidine glycosylase/DNA-(apurinic or apyrimidinic site) lyase [Paracidovorax valerianellae]SDC70982.1 DNA-(apurinic or apyrimidinic site) lyase [Paracidovorax valerianellae]